MKTILVTGARGFVGKNLCVALRREGGFEVVGFGSEDAIADLPALVGRADLVFHLAGVNRSDNEADFERVNVELTREVCRHLAASERSVPLVVSSSIQASADHVYGRSKRGGEQIVEDYHRKTGRPVYLFRLPNVFGKWSKPNYNTVVATFCHNISRDLPVQVSDPGRLLSFVYIDDVVRAFLQIARRGAHDGESCHGEIKQVYQITLGELHDLLRSFRDSREKSLLPDLANPLVKHLYSTYLAFHDPRNLAYPVDLKTDERGWLFELVKSRSAGQIFVSRTAPGITRGNHYHDSKVEKFCVIKGEGVIRFRSALGGDVIAYEVNDREIQIVDVPPGYTHSIENVGADEMLTLFWANEIFDPKRPDTYFEKV